jgi:hypothetical protein
MKSFLLKGKQPIVKWGMLPNNIYFEGNVPEGYNLAVSPSDKYIVIDVDRHGDSDGFKNIPEDIILELEKTLSYNTKNNGKHYWLEYFGGKPLANKTSGLGYDLRTNRGYVVWYDKRDIRNCLHLINKTSENLNIWLETWFSYR